jgi:hypothetical protein
LIGRMASPWRSPLTIQKGRLTPENMVIQETAKRHGAPAFRLSVGVHPAFGALATLRLVGQADRRFTFQEARHVASALDAVATGASPERQIFMSPIASDADFEASATPDGLVVAAPAEGAALTLAWPEIRDLAAALRRATQTPASA